MWHNSRSSLRWQSSYELPEVAQIEELTEVTQLEEFPEVAQFEVSPRWHNSRS